MFIGGNKDYISMLCNTYISSLALFWTKMRS